MNQSLEALTQEDFIMVQDDSNYRSTFVEKIPLSPISKYVLKLDYISQEKFFDNYIMSTRTTGFLAEVLNFKKRKSDIIIFDLAFSKQIHPNLDDFLCTLYHHEGHHAKETFEDPKLINYPILSDILHFFLNHPLSIMYEKSAKKFPSYKRYINSEIRALENQIKNINSKNSSDYVERLQECLKLFKKELELL